jgi:hypothetical protein
MSQLFTPVRVGRYTPKNRLVSHLASSGNRIVSPTGLSPAWDPTPALAA